MKSELRPRLITIDGPVAVGKSTIGQLLAERLGYSFIDTGMMYRALTWKVLYSGIDPTNEEKLFQLATATQIEFVPVGIQGKTYRVFVDGKDVTSELRSEEVERNVSLVSKVAGVRQVMVAKQRWMALEGKVVMVGRDIGTVVLPEAELKIFLIASPEERARRRYQELLNQGNKGDYEAVLADLQRRDEIDSKRLISPLQPATEAKIIDTEGLTPEQVVQKIMTFVEDEKTAFQNC